MTKTSRTLLDSVAERSVQIPASCAMSERIAAETYYAFIPHTSATARATTDRHVGDACAVPIILRPSGKRQSGRTSPIQSSLR